MAKFKIHKLHAKSISYGSKRNLKDIRYIVIHYTGNENDTAKGNCNYFATSNTRLAGAHFFVDKKGEVWKSINMNLSAYAVGNIYPRIAGGGTYYKKCTNSNSVSIELCDCTKSSNWEQMLATRQLVLYIQKKCPNAKTIIRHFDVNNKTCPAPMIGVNNKKWIEFKAFLEGKIKFKAKVIEDVAIRSSAKITPTNKIGKIRKGKKVQIIKLKGNFGLIKSNDPEKKEWISLSKINAI